MSQGFSRDPANKVEDSAHASGDEGKFILTVRDDALASQSSTDGDYQPLLTDANGRVWTRATVDAELPAGTQNIGDVDVVSLPGNLAGYTEGDTDASITGVAIMYEGVANALVAAGTPNPLPVNDTASQAYLASLGTLVKVEDEASADGDHGVLGLTVRDDDPAATTTTDGDFQPFKTDSRGALHVTEGCSTGTTSSVGDSATSVTLLAANVNRKGATIWNDSSAILYVKFGTTASATDCTVKMVADAYYEVPFGYRGRLDGVWASDAGGAARITELT